jgi:hypothetical protein
MTHSSLTARVLAIDPTTRGLAYTVFEGSELILEWGASHVMPEKKNALCLQRAERLFALYAPDVLVLEAYDGEGSRREKRVRSLIRSLRRLAVRNRIGVRSFSRSQIREAFARLGKPTRQIIASEIALRYPELSWRLPAPRKFYESEAERMSIFDAAALAVTYFETRKERLKPAVAEPKPSLAA